MSPGRIRAGLIASALTIVSSLLAAAPVAAAPGPVPRVVIVVGPAGAATDRYRAQARDAAARRPPVHRGRHRDLFPERDLAGRPAGPPGRERRHLHGPRQRLAEPVSRRAVSAHPERLRAQPERRGQRFRAPVLRRGGRRLTGPPRDRRRGPAPPPLLRQRQLRARRARGLARHARLRVDNFAAGFIRAGAAAVMADAYASPTAYLASILGGGRSIDPSGAAPPRPTATPSRSKPAEPGYIAQMDPEQPTSGFTRSIVMRAGLTPANVRAAPRGPARARSSRSDPSRRVWSRVPSGSDSRTSRRGPRPAASCAWACR